MRAPDSEVAGGAQKQHGATAVVCRICGDLLRDQLGVEPSLATQALFLDLLREGADADDDATG